jgi:hypothetical protein
VVRMTGMARRVALTPDELLDFRQVSVGFEVTPVSIISRASHRSVPSMTEKEASG